MGRKKKVTRDTIKSEIFDTLIALGIGFDAHVKLNNLIFDLDLEAYKAGLSKGGDIALEIYGSKKNTAKDKAPSEVRAEDLETSK